MEKLNVNQDACIGCGACVAIDPEHFEFNDNGFSEPIKQDNLNSESLKNAIESCPTSAISIMETEGCDCEVNGKCECDHCECSSCECDAN